MMCFILSPVVKSANVTKHNGNKTPIYYLVCEYFYLSQLDRLLSGMVFF